MITITIRIRFVVKADMDFFLSPFRQSKLSQEQLAELQKSTHFDKKELQQWYKGERHRHTEMEKTQSPSVP